MAMADARLQGYSICADVIFEITEAGILASNHRARQHVLLSLPLFNWLAGAEPDTSELQAWDRTTVSNLEGLLADPTCLNRDALGEPSRFGDVFEALEFLADRFILIRDLEAYRDYFAKRSSLIDQKHMGTFHQRVGAELLLRKKVDPDEWWYSQKFDPETGRVRDSLYRYVQKEFIDTYLGSLDFDGRAVLDFGCGSGLASQLFAADGAQVTGVDPDPVALATAEREVGAGFQPVHLDFSSADPLSKLPLGPFDFIWLSDVLLFYFYPQDAGEPVLAPAELLEQLANRLADGGRLAIMNPHAVFWLAPWLGDDEFPYTVITEYADRLYSVTPSLEELSVALEQAGLCICRVYEPRPSEDGRDTDPKAYHFAERFPVWWVFECAKAP
jgi:SAM-dependent methyltransferase